MTKIRLFYLLSFACVLNLILRLVDALVGKDIFGFCFPLSVLGYILWTKEDVMNASK